MERVGMPFLLYLNVGNHLQSVNSNLYRTNKLSCLLDCVSAVITRANFTSC